MIGSGNTGGGSARPRAAERPTVAAATEKPRVAVAITGAANIASVLSGLARAGADAFLTTKAEEIARARFAVLPGVGAFGPARRALADAGLDAAFAARVKAGAPTIGICLGMQLFCEGSDEAPGSIGLGIVPGVARRFPSGLPVPQLGWNRVSAGPVPKTIPTGLETEAGRAGPGIVREGWAYFANSYRLVGAPAGFRTWSATYGQSFVAALEGVDEGKRGLLLCQFHPELSGPWGLALLRRWLGIETADGTADATLAEIRAPGPARTTDLESVTIAPVHEIHATKPTRNSDSDRAAPRNGASIPEVRVTGPARTSNPDGAAPSNGASIPEVRVTGSPQTSFSDRTAPSKGVPIPEVRVTGSPLTSFSDRTEPSNGVPIPEVRVTGLPLTSFSDRAAGAIRVIPCLDLKDGRVVKGTKFKELKDAGDPVELSLRYEAEGADEIAMLDITATIEGRASSLEVLRRLRARIGIPIVMGGGLRTEEDAAAFLDAGADRVAVNSAAVRDPSLIERLARRFGRQCVVLAIDAAAGASPGRWSVFIEAGRLDAGLDAARWAAEGARLGAGELLVTSIDRDGTGTGFDLDLIAAVAEASGLPVVASGGAGTGEAGLRHFSAAARAGARALLAAGVFHRGELAVSDVKRGLEADGIGVRS